MARHKKHASENLRFSSHLRNKLLRKEDLYEKNSNLRLDRFNRNTDT